MHVFGLKFLLVKPDNLTWNAISPAERFIMNVSHLFIYFKICKEYSKRRKSMKLTGYQEKSTPLIIE